MFGKIFDSTFTGSLYGSGPVVFAVWAYVIANTKPPGVVELNPRLLAGAIGCSTEDIKRAIEFLEQPDENSRNPEHEGRRLVHLEAFIYRVASFQKYRDMRDDEERKRYQREWDRQNRPSGHARASKEQSDSSPTRSDTVRQSPTQSDQSDSSPTQAEAEAEAEVEKRKTVGGKPPTTPGAPKPARRARAKPAEVEWPCPRGVEPDTWAAFIEARQAKRAPMTEVALRGVLRTLEQAEECGHKPQDVIAPSANAGWAGVFMPKDRNGHPIVLEGSDAWYKQKMAGRPYV